MKQFNFRLEPVLAYRRLIENGEEEKLRGIQTAILKTQQTREDLGTQIELCGRNLEERSRGTIDMDEIRIVTRYLDKLREGVSASMAKFTPDMLFYVAGADPYREDQLGGLRLTLEGLAARDRLVLESARERKIPAHITLAGGYAVRVEDTVTIHANTVRAAKEVFKA